MIGLLLINHPIFSLLFLLLLLFILIRTQQLRFFLILCAVILIFSFRTYSFDKMNETELTGKEKTIAGKIVNIPFIDGDYAAVSWSFRPSSRRR